MTKPICFICEMKKYPKEKIKNQAFFLERKNEFYPEEEFGDYVEVCDECNLDLLFYSWSKSSAHDI